MRAFLDTNFLLDCVLPGRPEHAAAQTIKGLVDVGLIEAPSHNPHLTTLACCEDELVMICAPNNTLANRSSVDAREIAEQPYVSREHGSGTREVVDGIAG